MVKVKITFFTYAEPLVVDELKLALTHKKSFKAKLRIEVLIFRTRLDEKGEEHRTLVKEMLDIDKPPKAITNANVDKIGSSELKELNAKCDDVGTVGENGSGWIIKKFLNIFIDIYETNPIRAASYIPTPPKYNNSRCGLINIQNDDQECFEWCMKYHQSNKGSIRTAALKRP